MVMLRAPIIVALSRALEAKDERLSMPISALVALHNVFKNTIMRGPVGYTIDEETRREVDRLFDLVIRAVGDAE